MFLQRCTNLRTFGTVSIDNLILESCRQVDLASLSMVRGLRQLRLLAPGPLPSVDALRGCKSLESLVVTATPLGKTDFRVLGNLPSLKWIFLTVGDTRVAELSKALPRVMITNGSACFRGTKSVSREQYYRESNTANFTWGAWLPSGLIHWWSGRRAEPDGSAAASSCRRPDVPAFRCLQERRAQANPCRMVESGLVDVKTEGWPVLRDKHGEAWDCPSGIWHIGARTSTGLLYGAREPRSSCQRRGQLGAAVARNHQTAGDRTAVLYKNSEPPPSSEPVPVLQAGRHRRSADGRLRLGDTRSKFASCHVRQSIGDYINFVAAVTGMCRLVVYRLYSLESFDVDRNCEVV